jgi:hypothetical protein
MAEEDSDHSIVIVMEKNRERWHQIHTQLLSITTRWITMTMRNTSMKYLTNIQVDKQEAM